MRLAYSQTAWDDPNSSFVVVRELIDGEWWNVNATRYYSHDKAMDIVNRYNKIFGVNSNA